MDLEYWKNRLSSGINYDTMVGWDKVTILDETSKLFDQFRQMTGCKFGKVLDYGCGLGRFTNFFRAEGIEYIGTDLLKEVIDGNAIEMSDVSWKLLSEYSEDDASDLVFLSTVFQYFTDDEARDFLTRELDNTKHVFIIESLADVGANLRSHEHNRQPQQIMDMSIDCGWNIAGDKYFNSREKYYLIWLTK